MRKLNFKLIMLLMAAIPALLFSSCDEADPGPVVNEFQPVLNENFTFVIDGNNVKFATTMSGNVWVTANDVDYAMVDQKVTVTLPNKGTYSFKCGSLGSGAKLFSTAFDVVIAEDDLAFLETGLWKYLSGGANKTKTWRMDMTADAKLAWFAGPVFYSGDDNGKYWAWDVTDEVSPESPYTATLDNGSTKEFTSIFNWSPDYPGNTWLMAPRDYGTVTFDATNGTASSTVFGETVDGTFTFNLETMKLTFGGGVMLPIDTGRVNEGQFKEEDLANLRIFSLTDSAMQIGIKRSFEGTNDDGSQKESKWTMVYNFVVVGYTYAPEVFTFSEPVQTSFTMNDLVGTWKYDGVAQDWIGWPSSGTKGSSTATKLLNNWADRATMTSTLVSWGAADAEAVFTAGDANSYVFNNDGTCTLAGIDNTYSVSNGIITFGTALTTEFSLVWIGISGTTVPVIDLSTAGNIWIGNKNGDKNESSSVHLVKQAD